MPYSEAVLRRASERLRRSAEDKKAEYAAHLELAYEKYPRLREIDRRLRRSVAEAVSLSFSRGGDPEAAIAALRDENLRLQNERQWILDASDFEEGFLDDTPVCTVCGGRGYVGARMCECLRELCRQEQKKELSRLLQGGKDRFESFDLHYYSNEYDPALGASPRHMMQLTLSTCRRYAANFQPGTSGNLLFSGATGLGKTFLSACIARQLTDAGHAVSYVSAGKLIADCEAVKFSGADEELLRQYESCELLIIDDLGTEMRTQFVNSALYMIVNERLLQRRAMLVSTNLRPEDLEGRYGPQLASRLLGCFQLLSFVGSDIRPMLR